MRTLPLLFMALAIAIPVDAQESGVAIEDLKWSAIVSGENATFTFPPSKRTDWSWHNADTPADRLEYTWSIAIGDDESGYQFGPALFHSGDSKTTNGTLGELLETCQQDLWRVSKDGGENVGGYGNAKLKNGSVTVSISNEKRIKLLFESAPEIVYMSIRTPEFFIRQRVTVAYKK